MRAARRLPIVGPLADCRIEYHFTAGKQFGVDLFFSTMPLWGGTVGILLTSTDQISVLDALFRTFERGELFIFCTATLGPIIYISNRDMRDGSTFPTKFSFLIAVFAIVILCAIAFSLYRADMVLNEILAFRLSVYAYAFSLCLYYLTILYDALRVTGASAVFRKDTADFLNEFGERH